MSKAEGRQTSCPVCKKIWEPQNWERYSQICGCCLKLKRKWERSFKKQIDELPELPKVAETVIKEESVQPPPPSVVKVEPIPKFVRDPYFQRIRVEKTDK